MAGIELQFDNSRILSQLRAIERELKQIDASVGRAQSALNRTGSGAAGLDRIGTSARNAGRQIQDLDGSSRRASTSQQQMGQASGRAAGQLGQLRGASQQARGGLTTLISSTTGLVAGLAGIGLGLKSAVSSFVDYDSTMRRVGAISGATEAQMERMRATAQELGASTKFSAGQAAEGLQFLAMAGLDAEESITALPGVLNLAAAGAMDLGTAADIATNILSGYGFEVDQLSRVNDVLAKSFTSSNTNLQQLGTAFTTAGSVAAAAGQEFEVTAGVLSLMANAGFAGTRSGTALRGALARLLKPTGEVTDTLTKLGVEVHDSSGNLRSLDAIMIELSNTGLSAGDAIALFGQEAGPAMLAAIRQGEEGITGMVEKMRNAEGTAETVAGALKGSLGGALTEMGSAAEGAGIALIGIMEPALVTFFEVIGGTIRLAATALGTFDDEAQAVVTGLAALVAYRTLTPIIAGLGSAALTAAGGMTTAAGAATALRAALALLGGPAGILIAVGTAAFIYRDTLLALLGATDDTAAATERHVTELDKAVGATLDAETQADKLVAALSDEERAALDAALASDEHSTALGIAEGSAIAAALESRNLAGDLRTEAQQAIKTAEAQLELAAARVFELENAIRLTERAIENSERMNASDLARFGTAAAEAGERLVGMNTDLDAQRQALDQWGKRIKTSQDRLAGLTVTVEENSRETNTNTGETETNTGARGGNAAAVKDQTSALEKQLRSIMQAKTDSERLLAIIETENVTRDQATTLLELENAAREAGVEITEQQREGILATIEATEANQAAIAELTKETESGTEATKQAVAEQERAWKQLGDSIQSNLSSAFVNLVDKGLSSFSDLVDTIKTWFVKLLADLAAAALAKPIMLAIGATGMGSMINPALAGGAPGGAPGGGLFDLAGSGASLVNAGSSVAGLLGFGGAAAGTAGIVGGSASAAAGIGGGLGALGGSSFGAASATGGMMAAASAALPVLLPIAGAILAFGGLFGGKPSNKAAFADINLASGGVDLSAMTGDKAPSQDTLELRDALASSVAAFATALGEFSDVTLETVRLDIGERDGIQADFGAGLVSFGNDIEAAMTAIFERIAGQAQGLAAWLQDLAGMDLAAALQGLLIIRELNPLFERLGQSAIALDAAGAQAGAHLLALAGDIETLTGRMDRYYQAFFSTEERLGHLTEDLTAQFDALGLTMPSTKAGLRELIESLDLTTDAGRESFVALMELAPGFATLVEGQAALLDAERQRIDEMLRMAGISGDQIATTLRDAMLGRISADDAGGLIAEQVLGGIHNAVAGGFANQITTLFMDTIVTPAVQAAVTGGSVAEAVSQAAIDNMIAQAKAAAAALGAILNDPGFKQALADIGQVITDSVTTITPARPYTPPARTFTPAVSVPTASAPTASAAAADEAFSTAAELRRALLLDTLGSTGSALDRLGGWFDEMRDAAGRLGVDMGEVTGVLTAQLRELTASWDPATLRDMAGHFPDLATQLLALADTADAATTAAQQQANAQAGAELRDNLARQLMSGAHRALADLVGWLEATGASATDLGVDLGLVQQVFEQRFSALLDGLPLDQLDALVALFPAFGDRIDGVATQMRAAAAAAQHQAAAQAALVRQQAGSAFLDDLMAQIYGLTDQAWVNDAAKAIQDYQDGLADAADLGVDAADRLDTILGLSLQNLMAQAGLTGSQLGQLTDLFPEFAEQLQQAFDTVLDARNAAAAQQRANDAVTASATAAADSTTAAADSIERLARAADPGAPSTDPYAQRADWLRAWADQMPEAVATIGARPAAGANNQSPQRPGYAALLSGMHDAVQQWQDAGRPRGEQFAAMHTAIRAWRAEQARRETLTDPPGFAAGGTHPGGWRMVGERGPELEFTPPSRIFSAPDTRAMVGNDLAAEVRALREELRVAQYRIAKNTGKTAKYLERWDGDGLPPERTTT